MSKPVSVSIPETVTSKTLAALVGLTERRLRQLADEAWFPAPVRGKWLLAPVVGGLLRYYRELVEESQDDKLKEVRHAILSDQLKISRGQLVEVSRVRAEAQQTYKITRDRLRSIPDHLAIACGLDAAGQAMAGKTIDDALNGIAATLEKLDHATPKKAK